MRSGKKILASAVAAALIVSSMGACSTRGNSSSAAGGAQTQSAAQSGGKIKEFKAFFAVPNPEINDNNEVQQKIADITGAKCKETWLTGQSAKEAIGTLIAGGEYPDFIDGSDSTKQLVEAGALVALDDYIDKYPNIKNYFTKQQWDELKQAGGGHIYYIPQFSVTHDKPTNTLHNDEAFWIQTRVLKWANYPKIETMDEYFDLIERYLKANPTMKDGSKNIGYTILCDDWRYFCLENAPQFLDGFPNDGRVMVDTQTHKILDYNTSATAKLYFQKLNTEYKKGIVDPESFTQKYDQYISKLSTGRVLGMIDQWWDFDTNVNQSLRTQKLDQQGCDYVPLPITIKKGVHNQWHTTSNILNVASGLGITTSCKDIEGALQFVNGLLSQEANTLMNWGEKGADYEVDKDGMFYRTQKQRDDASDTNYKASHLCPYSYFPNYRGMNLDNKNATKPEEQVSEFYTHLSQDVKDCFTAYGVKTYVGMIGDNNAPGPWFPMYTYTDTIPTSDPAAKAWTKMDETKHEWLPKVCMASNFDSEWSSYLSKYQACKPEDFLNKMQTECARRIESAKKYTAS